MNLQTHIRESLWLAVQSTYESGNYCGAVLDAMHYLSSTIREKTGVDGDGVALVGQAFGGDAPRLRINKLQTETERNEQKGIESILRGMYHLIRNPRSHEQIEDTQETADAIIYFVDYLLHFIERAEEPFVLSKFTAMVFDTDFNRSQQYAESLVDMILAHKRFDTLVSIYRDKYNGDIYNIGLVVRTLIGGLSEDKTRDYLMIVSEELTQVSEHKQFMYNLHLLPHNLWERLSDIARLRVEGRIIREIKEGQSHGIGGKCISGALATWARQHVQHFKLREQVAATFVEKLESDDWYSKYYIVEFFLAQLPEVVQSPYRTERCVKAISHAVRTGNQEMRNSLIEHITELPLDWQRKLAEALKKMTNEETPAAYLTDGTPFLSSNLPAADEDGIPF
jgi:uncharacterized protein (TIGR02391 family)